MNKLCHAVPLGLPRHSKDRPLKLIAAAVALLVALASSRVQAESTNAPDPMLQPLDTAGLQETIRRNAGNAALVFTESREFPIRRVQGLPARWLPQTQAARVSFASTEII